MWVVMRLRKWGEVELDCENASLPPSRLKAPADGSSGFLEVFETREQALAVENDVALIHQIEVVKGSQ